MRKLFYISPDKELATISKLKYDMTRNGVFDWVDDRTLMCCVSPDFSGIVSTHLAQFLSYHRPEKMYIDTIHVRDPDEELAPFIDRFRAEFPLIQRGFEELSYHKFILCEAGIISGSNYTWLLDEMTNTFGVPRENIKTVALFENKHSKFKCDYVGEYYDDSTQDLCFHWESPNAAFGDFSDTQSK